MARHSTAPLYAMVATVFSADHYKGLTFDFEEFIKSELGLDLDNQVRREDEPICKYFLKGACSKGANCPFKHKSHERDKSVVCKHWLRGLCKKGDSCEFLHVFNMKKMPECWFYSKYGECCNGDECMYLHIDPESKQKECPWYARGFCKHGPFCHHKHVRRMVCQNYLTGFCPDGLNCPNGHPKYELPVMHSTEDDRQTTSQSHQQPHHPQQTGGDETGRTHINRPANGFYRRLEDVTCYKCGQQGHYANKCPQGRGGAIV
ncbi:uncharacterized protein BYT42DRAFT_526075 [Radiomyces spectabilis]|uniref:uncharacterized protein n=1 Tax=Radiomyces spectabilis TaxID=64574 RepID=UPI002220AB15|nr:uncharacterized protein BYT42DRAFT_526075 [Radiomyces spectabilis]KAI8390897.1 hypothetical protein BYT42DRAFT_526075 [Radiomyces spectabilis]